MSAAQCRRLADSAAAQYADRAKAQSCIEALAAGWINPPDLCPACTRAFMAALDWVAEPVTLKWHEAYIARADGTGEVPS